MKKKKKHSLWFKNLLKEREATKAGHVSHSPGEAWPAVHRRDDPYRALVQRFGNKPS